MYNPEEGIIINLINLVHEISKDRTNSPADFIPVFRYHLKTGLLSLTYKCHEITAQETLEGWQRCLDVSTTNFLK